MEIWHQLAELKIEGMVEQGAGAERAAVATEGVSGH